MSKHKNSSKIILLLFITEYYFLFRLWAVICCFCYTFCIFVYAAVILKPSEYMNNAISVVRGQRSGSSGAWKKSMFCTRALQQSERLESSSSLHSLHQSSCLFTEQETGKLENADSIIIIGCVSSPFGFKMHSLLTGKCNIWEFRVQKKEDKWVISWRKKNMDLTHSCIWKRWIYYNCFIKHEIDGYCCIKFYFILFKSHYYNLFYIYIYI